MTHDDIIVDCFAGGWRKNTESCNEATIRWSNGIRNIRRYIL